MKVRTLLLCALSGTTFALGRNQAECPLHRRGLSQSLGRHLGRNKQTKTPNIDRVTAMGVTFTNAQCAAPVCNPSRAALLSGKLPGNTAIYDNNNPFMNVLKPDESLVMQFRNTGYETLGTGKIWHGGLGWKKQWTATGHETAVKGKVVSRSIDGISFCPIVEGGEMGRPSGLGWETVRVKFIIHTERGSSRAKSSGLLEAREVRGVYSALGTTRTRSLSSAPIPWRLLPPSMTNDK